MKDLAIVFFLLAVLILIPPLLLLLQSYPGSFAQKFESAVSEFDGTIISLGTLFLVSGLALLTTHLSNRSSEKREAANRLISTEMKIAEMRKKWIDDLRDDLAVFSSLVSTESGPESMREEVELASRILLRLNPKDPNYDSLREHLKSASGEFGAEDPDMSELVALREVSQKILKHEWERLKHDIKNAHMLEGERT
ncbi:hypothetical protein D1823_14035 [Ruegeria sp. AD91A]|uniref:hypothetical protein n=1 Tax=Ruegeria sp. AD91A TaxID=2293862 RepID=UPI000E49F193|nr:hypothetical protein [Ruegeria sp. AD91A]AXT27597.1 hypothetical protein D1823_14035 [Ruegeria sp. AD91A]